MNFSRFSRIKAIRALSFLSSASFLHYATHEQQRDAPSFKHKPVSALLSTLMVSTKTVCDSSNEEKEHPQMDDLLQSLMHISKSVIESHAVPVELDMDIRFMAFCEEVQKVLTEEGQVELNEDELAARGKPWNSYHTVAQVPRAILTPTTTEQVSEVVRLCYKYRISIVPFGGGTSLEGHTLAPKSKDKLCISLDFNKMKSIIELNVTDLDVTVQAGIGYIELNEFLKPYGVWFPLDPGPGASVGGMCACRCSGSTAVKYGSMRDNVLNIKGVLADHTGTVFKTGSRARKSSAGYDITRLLVGSEGTLGVITEATLKLHPIPRQSYALRIAFPSVSQAAACARDTLSSGLSIGRCEMLDEIVIRDINAANPSLPSPWPEQVTLLYEVTGHSTSSVNEQIQLVTEIAVKNGGMDIHTATDKDTVQAIWKIRKECLWSVMSQSPEREPMITDVCVPLSELPKLITASRELTDASFLHAPMIAHAGDGNFHALIMFDPASEKEKKEALRLAHFMADQAIMLGGTCTGEHGIGVGKKDHLKLEMGPGTMSVMHKIKKAMDEENILNPEKVV